jgi:hypothetical protein
MLGDPAIGLKRQFIFDEIAFDLGEVETLSYLVT